VTEFSKQITEIADSGLLGRSPVYERLLRYLGERTVQGSLPKEIDIATDVFERNDFDPSKDSTVRVYLHNLRQKLDAYYESLPQCPEQRIRIPKGEYRLVLAASAAAEPLSPTVSRDFTYWYAGIAVTAIAIAFLVGRITSPVAASFDASLATTDVWRAVVANDTPVIVVVGDYYVFAELDENGFSNRLIRDFSINDSESFDRYMESRPELEAKYLDIRLSYLPLGIGSALESVVRVLHTRNKAVRVIPQSQFQTLMLREAHIIYVGYLSGMGRLARYPFAASRLAIGMSYDELIDTESGERYLSLAGYVTDSDVGYTDYGYFSTFPGPSDNQFLVVAGMRDEGLMRMAAILTDATELRDMSDVLGNSDQSSNRPAFETLYEVSSLDRTYVTAKRLFVSPLEPSSIWDN
jgi:hypothetical protein